MSNAPTKKEQTVKAFNNLINNNKFTIKQRIRKIKTNNLVALKN